MTPLVLDDLDESDVARLAACLALKVTTGDCLALHGDLGAGKTAFARAFIRACLGDPEAEVPSPTFAIEQLYDAPRFAIAHYDLYRLAGADDLDGIGFDERAATAVTLVEWPERAEAALPRERIDIHFETCADPVRRTLRIVATTASLTARAARAATIARFLSAEPTWQHARVAFLNGDASTRAYARLHLDDDRTAILMDSPRQADGPPVRDGLPYSRIAHLAEDVRPFVAVQAGLRASGIAAPELYAHDLAEGLLLMSDLGDLSFGRAVAEGVPQAGLWQQATDVLIALRRKPLPRDLTLPDGTTHRLPRFDRAALEIELDLLLDWYWPHAKGAPASDADRMAFRSLWAPMLDAMLVEPPGIFLRDFHSPNLFWRPHEIGCDRVGVIDFQDALAEPWSYDLASLLQDARVDVPRGLEASELDRYVRAVGAFEPAFDAEAFRASYATFGAQRNTRLVGLWVRLLQRDNKPNYMQHMARTWDYVARNLAHPRLAPLAAWYETHFPQEMAVARARR